MHYFRRAVLVLLTVLLVCPYANADTFVPKPVAPASLDGLIGETISFEISEEMVSDFYWETPDTIWIKKVKNPKIGKHYRLEKNPYHGSLTDNEKYTPLPNSFLFSSAERGQVGITPAEFVTNLTFRVLDVTRSYRGSEALTYSNSYRTTVAQVHLQREDNGDLLYWEVLNTESKAFGTRTNYSPVKIILQDVADAAYQSLGLKDYYTGPGTAIEDYRPCHIAGARYVASINLASSYRNELEGTLYFFGNYDDGSSLEFNNDYPRNLLSESEYNDRMITRMRSLANQGHYSSHLIRVKKPANSKIRNGKLLEEETEGKTIYEDNYLTFVLGAMEKEVIVFIQNKTDYTMKVLWDDAAFISPYGKTQRVIHSGVAPKDKALPQPSSVIPGHSILNDHIVPADNISFSSILSEWQIAPLIPGITTMGKYPEGASFSVLIPIQISGVTNEYLFTFSLVWVYDNPSIREAYLASHPIDKT